MRRVILGPSIAILAMLLLGCQSDAGLEGSSLEPTVTYTGVASPECSPWDGGAYRIVLAPGATCSVVPASRLELWVYRGFPLHAGSIVRFGPGRDEGLALECPAASPCVPAAEGTIELDRFEEGLGMSGMHEITLPDGRTLRGRFDVTWCAATPLCG